MPHQEFLTRVKGIPIFSSVDRIFQATTDFIRGNPIVSTASVGAGITGLVAGAAIIRSKRKKKRISKRKKRKAGVRTRKGKKKTKTQIRAMRLRNLAKARRARGKGKRRRKIIRGPGLGTREIKHSGKGTRGKFKLVKFRDKRTGKIVSFKARK